MAAIELPMKVAAPSKAFIYYPGGDLLEIDLKPGETIMVRHPTYWTRIIRDLSEPWTGNIRYNNRGDIYTTYIKNLVPPDTRDRFGPDILCDETNLPRSPPQLPHPKEMWLPSYYAAVLQSGKRDTLIDFNSFLGRGSDHSGQDYRYYPWYEDLSYRIHRAMVLFFDAGICGDIFSRFLIQSIAKTAQGYTVRCVGTEKFISYGVDLTAFQGGDATFLLDIDGEYMDMYLGDRAHKVVSLVRVREGFIREFQNLMTSDTCDLSKVRWPQRKNGSIFPPAPRFIATYRTKNDTNLYYTAAFYAEAFLGVAKSNTGVYCFDEGMAYHQDPYIQSPAFEVGTADRQWGWCLASDLEPVFYRTSANLRLRDAGGNGGAILVTLPKDTTLQVLEIGAVVTIDDITAPWVRVRTGEGRSAKEGWCFGGYLEEVQ